jgi:hypothetical protein
MLLNIPKKGPYINVINNNNIAILGTIAKYAVTMVGEPS